MTHWVKSWVTVPGDWKYQVPCPKLIGFGESNVHIDLIFIDIDRKMSPGQNLDGIMTAGFWNNILLT